VRPEVDAMAMGRKRPVQQPLFVRSDELAGAPRHRFYEKLNELLDGAGFDAFVEEQCRPFFAEDGKAGRISTRPGMYFRMLFIGYFEGIESERGICWRVEDSLSLRSFLGIATHETTPDHSTLSRMRSRLAPEVYEAVFHFVMRVLNEQGLLRGRVAGVDSTYLRADASMKSIVRRGSGEGYKSYLKKLARKAGIENPTDEDARRIDRTREKKTSNEEWVSPTDADAEITRIKDGRTRLAYKAENTVDMETGAILAAEVLPATTPDGESVIASVQKANGNVAAARDDDDDDDDDDGASGATNAIEEVVGDKGFHKASTIKRLADDGVRTYFPERKQRGERRWKKNGGRSTAVAVYQNRKRLKSKKSKELQRRRGELLERTFAHLCETGGHRRTRLRGRENVQKRYLMQAAAFNLSLVMRKLVGHGTPRALAAAADRFFAAFVIAISHVLVALDMIVDDRSDDRASGRRIAEMAREPWFTHSSTGC
jgi:transposase